MGSSPAGAAAANLLTFLAVLATMPVRAQERPNRQPRGRDRDHRNARRSLRPMVWSGWRKCGSEGSINGFDARHRPQEPRAAIYPRRPGIRLDSNELVFTRGLEDYFTIVQWDSAHRKTYLLTDFAKIVPTSHASA